VSLENVESKVCRDLCEGGVVLNVSSVDRRDIGVLSRGQGNFPHEWQRLFNMTERLLLACSCWSVWILRVFNAT
jgi:hypothetical protein